MLISVIKSEAIKFFSFSWCLIGGGATLLIPLIILIMSPDRLLTKELLLNQSLKMLYMGQLGVIVFSAAFWGQEYLGSSLRTSLLGTPDRNQWVIAKSLFLLLAVGMMTILTAVSCLVIGTIKFKLTVDISFLISYGRHLIGPGVSWLQLAGISAGMAILTQSIIVPIAVLGSMSLGLSQMLLGVSPLAIYLPNLASFNAFVLPTSPSFLEPRTGLVVQFLWLACFGGLGAYLLQRQEVS